MAHSFQPEEGEERSRTEEQEERTEQAQKAYCEACEESGLKVSSWQHFDGWKEFVDGKVDETVLHAKAQTELEEFAKSFGKFLVIEKEDPTHSDDTVRKERAKRANRIYRKLCEAAGLTLCFFNSFSTWSDFVEGKINESEFLELVKQEIDRMAREAG